MALMSDTPMASRLKGDAEHWRICAAEARTMAGEQTVGDAKALILKLAKDYDWLAEWAESNPKKQVLNGAHLSPLRRSLKAGNSQAEGGSGEIREIRKKQKE